MTSIPQYTQFNWYVHHDAFLVCRLSQEEVVCPRWSFVHKDILEESDTLSPSVCSTLNPRWTCKQGKILIMYFKQWYMSTLCLFD